MCSGGSWFLVILSNGPGWGGILIDSSLSGSNTVDVIAILIDLQSAKATADRKSASKPIGFEGDLRGQSSDIPERLHSQEVDLGSSQGDCLMAGNDSEEALTALMSRKTAISLFEGKALGLDKAILHSIDCCCKHIWGS